jgi:hypothetical protein
MKRFYLGAWALMVVGAMAFASPPVGTPGAIVVTIPQSTADQMTPDMTSSKFPFTMNAGSYTLTWSDAVQTSGGAVGGYIYSFDAHHSLVIVQSDDIDADGGNWANGGVLFLAEGRTEARGDYLTIAAASVTSRHNSAQDFTGETFALPSGSSGSSGNGSSSTGSDSGGNPGGTGTGVSLPNLGLGGANGAGGGTSGVVGGVAGQVAGAIGGGLGLGGAIFGVVKGFRALKAITGGR